VRMRLFNPRGYRRSAYASYRKRRQRRAVVALLLIGLGLVALFGYIHLRGRQGAGEGAPGPAEAVAEGATEAVKAAAVGGEPTGRREEVSPGAVEDLTERSRAAILGLQAALAAIGVRQDEAKLETVVVKEPAPARHLRLTGRYAVLAGKTLDETIASVSAGLRMVGASVLVRAANDGGQELEVLYNGYSVARVVLSREGPIVAIIIDDCGYPRESDEMALSLPYTVTLSVLPGLSNSRAVAERAVRVGKEVILHMPMEALGDADPGEGAIKVGQPSEAIKNFVTLAIEYAPQAIGMSNHMGSKATQDEAVMRAVMSVLAARGLFFVDSLTSPDSVACAVAKDMGVPCIKRDVFLDNEYEPGYIKGQLAILREKVLASGRGLGIGHSNVVTVATLAEVLPDFERDGIAVVGVSRLFR